MLRANHATIAALFLIYVLPLDPLGFASGPSYPFWTRLSYMFFHVNIWHLIGNSYALKVMRIGKREIARSYIMAVLASFFSTSPVIGASAMIFATWGERLASAKWRDRAIWASSLVISYVIPGISWEIHLASSLIGFCWIKLYNLYHDYRSVSRGE